MLFPLLCFYLCVNILDTRQKIYGMLGVFFIVGMIDASILDAYYLSGHGWAFQSIEMGATRIVTKSSADLMVFVSMTVLAFSASSSHFLTGWRRVLAYLGCLPMLFAVIFSYRRTHWIGMMAALIVFYALSSSFEKRKALVWAWAGAVMLTAALLFAGNGGSTKVFDPIIRRVSEIGDPRQDSNMHHLLETQQVFKDMLSSPVLGLGLGSKHTPVSDIDWAAEDQPTRVVHNTYLMIWMKLGLPGLFLFLWIAVKYVMALLSYRKSTFSPNLRPVIAATGATAGHWFVLLLTGPVPAYWYQSFIFTLFPAMFFTLIREGQMEETEEVINSMPDLIMPVTENHRALT
jgi:O-antigen ligase